MSPQNTSLPPIGAPHPSNGNGQSPPVLNERMAQGVGMVDEIVVNQLREMTENALLSRREIFRAMSDPRRDIGKECGYPDRGKLGGADSIELFEDLFDREPLANRVVKVLPRECWASQPSVYEDEDADVITPFEQAWDELCRTLSDKSWHSGEYSNIIWNHLYRADVLSGIGRYGVILLGFDDIVEGGPRTLADPVEGLNPKTGRPLQELKTPPLRPKTKPTEEEDDEEDVPTEEDNEDDEQVSIKKPPRPTGNALDDSDNPVESDVEDPDEETADTDEEPDVDEAEGDPNKPVSTKRKLLFMRAFGEKLAQIRKFDNDPYSPRFGQPETYFITLGDLEHIVSGEMGVSGFSKSLDVHWTRIIHVADNRLDSETFGEPRMQPVYNRLWDCYKLYGGSAEMYWRGAFPGLSIETHPSLGGDVDVDPDSMKDVMEQYFNGFQRYLNPVGMAVKTLAPQVVDPTPQINTQIDSICIQLEMPKRIFMGSERGELASSQDDTTWKDRLTTRQNLYLTPCLIVPFVNRLISVGVLPVPREFYVTWPDLNVMSPAVKADVAQKNTSAIAQYIQGGGDGLIEPLDFFTRIMGFEDDVARAVIDAKAKTVEEEDTGDSPLLSMVGGLTGILELFKAHKDKAVGTETLTQLLQLFFGVDEKKARAIVADSEQMEDPTAALAGLPGMPPAGAPGAGGKPSFGKPGASQPGKPSFGGKAPIGAGGQVPPKPGASLFGASLFGANPFQTKPGAVKSAQEKAGKKPPFTKNAKRTTKKGAK